jgi:bacterioferritin-associated ferredoxin
MIISHCICHEISFQSIKEMADKLNITDIAELQRELDFGLNCSMCLPYVNRTLKTGETKFSELITDDV